MRRRALACGGRVVVALGLGGGASALVGCAPGEPACGPARALVERVLDGDTIDLEGGERVRYLLVDTPELGDCYGEEARQYNNDLVAGKEVELVYDPDGCRDAFGRLLARISVGGREVNSLLVERGFACTLFIPPAGAELAADYEDLEQLSREAGRGMWSACAEVTCD